METADQEMERFVRRVMKTWVRIEISNRGKDLWLSKCFSFSPTQQPGGRYREALLHLSSNRG